MTTPTIDTTTLQADAKALAYETQLKILDAQHEGESPRKIGGWRGSLTRHASKVSQQHGVNVYEAISAGTTQAISEYHAERQQLRATTGELPNIEAMAYNYRNHGTGRPANQPTIPVASPDDPDADTGVPSAHIALLNDVYDAHTEMCRVERGQLTGTIHRAAIDSLKAAKRAGIPNDLVNVYRRRGMANGRRLAGAGKAGDA